MRVNRFAADGFAIALGGDARRGGQGNRAHAASKLEVDDPLAGPAAGPDGRAARQDLDAAQRLDRQCGDFAQVGDPLPVDDDQRQLTVVAELGLDIAQQLVDGADAIPFDLGWIEAPFGEDVAEQPLTDDDDVRLLRLAGLRIGSGDRIAGLGRYRGAGEQRRRGEPFQSAAVVRCT